VRLTAFFLFPEMLADELELIFGPPRGSNNGGCTHDLG
jgi:hypothetical protein